MDYCNGGTLSSFTKDRDLSEKEIWDFISQIIFGMYYITFFFYTFWKIHELKKKKYIYIYN